MEETEKFRSDLANIERSAFIIEKIHSCADCPIRKLAIKQPKSIFSKLHRWHSTWWPGWKAHQARTCPFSVSVNNPVQ
jgi:hypothetical protein